MGCGVSNTDNNSAGCSSGCSSGGCNKHNTFDWFANMPLSFYDNFKTVEISFKNGARKGFYKNNNNLDLFKGQLVVVEALQGYDIGEVSLQGELVRAQMKKRRVSERDGALKNILRIAGTQEIKQLQEDRSRENELLVRARAIAKSLNLEMKIGDVEFQGDGKKLTIFYTADDRVDFRELVKVYVRDFKVKIEMRQIGARQEAARIGGMGTCGRELCCSTWLHDFKSVTTNAVRYQNLSINTEKMSGQCGRLKCCLNFELDTYNDALKKFPKNNEKIATEEGLAVLRKTEILKKQLWYSYEENPHKIFKLNIETVAELLWMNKSGKKPTSLDNYAVLEEIKVDESKHDDLVGQVSLAILDEKHKKHKQKNKPVKSNDRPQQQNNKQQGGQQQRPQQNNQQKNKVQQPKNTTPTNKEQQRNADNSSQNNNNNNNKNKKYHKPKNKPNNNNTNPPKKDN